MPTNSLRPMRPIQRTPLVEEVLPVHNPEAAHKHGKPKPHPAHKPCAGFGLNTPAHEKQFAQGFKTLQQSWPKMTALQRKTQMEHLVNTQLQKSGVPHVGILSTSLATDNGQLDFSGWMLKISKDLVNKNSLSDTQAKELANTIYHESRHAEQWYLIAQQKAKQLASAVGETPVQKAQAIQTAMGIPFSVANQAQQHPLKAQDARTPCATVLNDSVYGKNATHRNNTLTGLDTATTATNHAQAHYDNLSHANATLHTTPGTSAAVLNQSDQLLNTALTQLVAKSDAAQKLYQMYRMLPEEADAWESGDGVGKVY